jgi:hypothetical protein
VASRAGVIGWAAGVLSTVLGALAFGAVLCLWFPAVLTTPALRDVYPMDLVRATIKWALGAAFLLGVLSVLLKRRKALGLTGAGLATLGTVMGGSEVAVAGPVTRSHHVGLDWFLLDLFLLSAIFVPVELLFGRLREQPIFRPGWRTDLWHFGVSHLVVQVTVLLTMAPAAVFLRWAIAPELQVAVARQPYALQFVACWSSRISPSTPCTARSTRSHRSGAFTRSTTRAGTSTGWRARASIWSTSSSRAASPSSPSTCWASPRRRRTRTFCSSPSTRC